MVTGATAGIGFAIANYLLRSEAQHLLILAGRNTQVLDEIKSKNPDRVVTTAGDMGDLDYVKSILPSVQLDGKLDGLILNHGTLGECQRIRDVDAGVWEQTFRVNVTSLAVLVSSHCWSLLPISGECDFHASWSSQLRMHLTTTRSNQDCHYYVPRREESYLHLPVRLPMRTHHGARTERRRQP